MASLKYYSNKQVADVLFLDAKIRPWDLFITMKAPLTWESLVIYTVLQRMVQEGGEEKTQIL
ncbi:hypothetical protein RC91_17905 [Pectobacterium brasiliense]|nr:hypothetical protein NC16_02295 [Pectobacterium brasiliense]KHS99324.1 hypothetical protein RC91_17905 [Pectobacterium brasiliense]